MSAFVVGSGTALPERRVTNEELAPLLGLEPEAIHRSSGIRSRRWVGDGENTGTLAATALRAALESSGIGPGDVDYLLLGTMTPNRLVPGTAPAVQHALGLGPVPALDIRAACCNTLYGLQLARALVESGAARCVGLAFAEAQSPWLDLSPAASGISMLFGDGAGALVVTAEPGPVALEVVDVLLGTSGEYTDDLGIRCPGAEFGTAAAPDGAPAPSDFRPRMAGQSVILHASRRLAAASTGVLERNGLAASDVRWVVPHQANANLLARLLTTLGLGREALVSVIEETGNTSSASMAIALDSLLRSGRPRSGDLVLLPAFGTGFAWGAALGRVSARGDAA